MSASKLLLRPTSDPTLDTNFQQVRDTLDKLSAAVSSLQNSLTSLTSTVTSNNARLGDWTSYTPTGSWTTNTTYTGFYKRSGDTMLVQVKVATSGAPTATNLTINIPSGFTIDTTKLVQAGNVPLGSAYTVVSSNGIFGLVSYNSTTSVVVFYEVTLSGTNPVLVQQGTVSSTAPQTFTSGSAVIVYFQVPIVGWS